MVLISSVITISNFIAVVGIGTFIGMLWMIGKADSCSGALLNGFLVCIAGIMLMLLVLLVGNYLGFWK